jgi:hypothetical protein
VGQHLVCPSRNRREKEGRNAHLVLAPCIGGIIVTFTHWRYIFWVQVGMGVIGLSTSLLFIPNIDKMNTSAMTNTVEAEKPKQSLVSRFNPLRVFILLAYPNVFLAVRTPNSFPLGENTRTKILGSNLWLSGMVSIRSAHLGS